MSVKRYRMNQFTDLFVVEFTVNSRTGCRFQRVNDCNNPSLMSFTIEVGVYVSDFRAVTVTGSAEVSPEPLQRDHVSIEFNGSGDVEMAGIQAAALEIHVRGAGNVQIGDVRTDDLDVYFRIWGSVAERLR